MLRALIEMDYPHPPTLVQLGNATSTSFIKGALKQKQKSIDMKYYSLQDRKQRNKSRFYWKPEKNLANPFTKHHSPNEHLCLRKIFNK